MKRCEAEGCVVDFTPQRSTARYCSATCRQRAGRARKAAERQAEHVEAEQAGREHSLVRAVRRELIDADALDTVAGQLALQIARRIAEPDGSGVSTLSKELRSLVAEATGRQPGAQPDGDGSGAPSPAPEPEVDELDDIRRRREEARQAAGLA